MNKVYFKKKRKNLATLDTKCRTRAADFLLACTIPKQILWIGITYCSFFSLFPAYQGSML
jgi:hypothetical protein